MSNTAFHLVQTPATHDARVGERVLMLMFRARITQTALGSAVGITQSALAKKLRGERKWTLDDLYAVASALGVSIFDILGNEKMPPTPKGGGPKLPELDSNQQPAG